MEIPSQDKKVIVRKKVTEKDSKILVDFLADNCDLSKMQIKKCLTAGGVWRKPEGRKSLMRARKAKIALGNGDQIEMHFDSKLLAIEPTPGVVICDTKNWGLWYKPAGLLSQGTKFGDHCAILRQVEKLKRDAYMVNRLDRETSGLIMIAYKGQAAGLLSNLWNQRTVRKYYQIEVLGDLEAGLGKKGIIEHELDGKEAITHFNVHEVTDFGTTLVWVEIKTGRKHQIRKHFDMEGFPVMGDPKYGTGNKNKDGMKMVATKLQFKDPMTKKQMEIELPPQYCLF